MSPPPALRVRPPAFEEIFENFSYLESWEERYRYVIELGRILPPCTAAFCTEENKVEGCASQVWLLCHWTEAPSGLSLELLGTSDAHIVRGLITLLCAIYAGKTLPEAQALDPEAAFQKIGLREHLTAQRSNGLSAMVRRIRGELQAAAGLTSFPAKHPSSCSERSMAP